MEVEWTGILNMLYYTNVGHTFLFWENNKWSDALANSSDKCVLEKKRNY